MRTWVKWGGVAIAALFAGSAIAADHGDGPAAGSSPESDITDVYAWLHEDGDKLILVQNVTGDFSSAVQYVFHVGRTDDAGGAVLGPAADWTNIVCELDSASNTACYVGTPGSEAVEWAQGDASDALVSNSGGMRVHAGQHADPFYFYLTGLNNARGTVRSLLEGGVLDESSFNEEGCILDAVMATDVSTIDPALPAVTASEYLLGQLNGTYDAAGQATSPSNDLAANNINSIVIEIDKNLFAGSGELFQVWASTHRK